MTVKEACDIVDRYDSHWYYMWCEREGSIKELMKYAKQLSKSA